MAAEYPDEIASFPTLSSTDEMDDTGKEGDVLGNKWSEEVVALQTEIGTNARGAAASVKDRIAADEAALAAHIADTSDAHDASAVSFAPVGTIAATDAQAAIAEVATDAAAALAAHVAAGDPHPAYALESALGGAAALNVGTTAGTVAAGDDSRLSDARTPTDASVTSAKLASTVITGLTAETTIADDDLIVIHDTSASALRKMTKANFVSGLGGGGGATDHGALTGLSDDDHSQYALLAGRSGGQTQVGGTASGESLTLQSTSNATRGGVKLASSDWLDVPEVSAPATPSAGRVAVYAKSDGKLYIKDDAGTETDLTRAGTITGSGTTNYLPRFTGASAIGDSAVKDNGTSVDVERLYLNVGAGGISTASAYVRVGQGRTGDGLSQIALISDTTYNSGGAILSREPGANGLSTFTHNGTGELRFVCAGLAPIVWATNGTDRWRVTSAGHWIADTDNTYDIGASGATRPRNLYLAGSVAVGDAATTRTNLDAARTNLVGSPCEIGIAVGDEASALTTGTAKVTFRMPYAMTLTAVRGSLTASGTGTTVDINEGGATVLSTKLTFDSGEKTTTTAATPAVISDSALADDAEITIDIDATSGSAAGLKIWLIGTRA